MIHIKVSIPGFGDKLSISQYLGNSENCYQNCQFHVNEPDLERSDFWFVLDDLQNPIEKVNVNPLNVYFLSAEVIQNIGYYDAPDKARFLDQFAQIISCHDIFRDNARYGLPFLPWMINANHGASIFEDVSKDVNWLMSIDKVEKSRLISVFCSSKTITPEHSARIKFVKKLKEHFGDRLDWFGSGVQPIDKKWDGIAPYKYHIALENKSRHNIITEKIYDSYLGLAYPIYWGAPNLGDYFSYDSFTSIELLDWRKAIETIESVLDENLWERKFKSLLDSKDKVLTEFNAFRRIAHIAMDTYRESENSYELVTIANMQQIRRRVEGGNFNLLLSRGGRFLQSVGRRLEMRNRS